MNLVETLKHPYSAVAGGLAIISGYLGMLDPLLQLIGATAGTWYPLIGILWRLGGMIPAVPKGAMSMLFIGGTVVYALYLGDSLLDRLENFIKNR